MSVKRRLLAVIASLALLNSLGCKAVTGLVGPAPAEAPYAVTAPPDESATETPFPSTDPPRRTPAPSLTATASPIPLTLTASPTRTATPTPTLTAGPPVTATPLQVRVFEELWQTVHDEYMYPDFNGLDWDAIHVQYRQRVEAGLTDEQFYLAMQEMIFRLGDDHSTFLSPDQVKQEDSEFSGENNFVGIGVLNAPVPERQRITIILVFPGSPAEQAGLKAHDSILAVDGEPIIDENGVRRNLLRGPADTQITVTVQSPGKPPRDVLITRRRISAATPVPAELLVTPGGKRIGYLLLTTLVEKTIVDEVGQALQRLSAAGPLDGLILDNRENTGGADTITKAVLGYFTHGTVGYFHNRQGRRAFNITGNNVSGSLRLPLVVLVGKGTVSFGEIASGILQDQGRAYVIGEDTEGNVEILWGYDFPDGSRAWIAHDYFRPINHPDANWEQTGIQPDQVVTSAWDQVTTQTDPVVLAALERLDAQK
jgi:carboxyl-terminal processing protease